MHSLTLKESVCIFNFSLVLRINIQKFNYVPWISNVCVWKRGCNLPKYGTKVDLNFKLYLVIQYNIGPVIFSVNVVHF